LINMQSALGLQAFAVTGLVAVEQSFDAKLVVACPVVVQGLAADVEGL